MVDAQLIDAFEDCVNRIAAGQAVEECIALYPQFALALRPMLEAGLLVKRAQFTPAEVEQARERVRLRIEATIDSPPRRTNIIRPIFYTLVTAAAAVVLIFFALLPFSENALPGDTLYSVKLLGEDVRQLAPGGKALSGEFRQRRIAEIQQLLSIQRPADVRFEGAIEKIDGNLWTVSGLPLTLTGDTVTTAPAVLGFSVDVIASTTADGQLIAHAIIPVDDGQLIEPITPTASPTLTPTRELATATDTPTLTATSTQLPSATPTQPTNTPIQPTRTPIVLPSQTSGVPACPPALPAGWIEYQVRSGDTLSGLAVATGITLQELMEVNCLEDARLAVGQLLFLPDEPVELIAPPPQNTPVNNTGSEANDNSSGSSDTSGGGGGSTNITNDNNDDGNDNDNDNGDDDGGNSGSGGGGGDDDDD